MTVKELIDKLSWYDPETKVFVLEDTRGEVDHFLYEGPYHEGVGSLDPNTGALLTGPGENDFKFILLD